MARNEPQINLRIPVELKEAIAAAASARQRTLTAEIVNRLRDTFELDYTGLPFEVVQAVEAEMSAHGITQAEALVKLVLAGQAGGGTVLNLKIAPGTTAKEVRDALSEALKHVPPDSNVVSTKI